MQTPQATAEQIRYVALRMRERDWAEFTAMSFLDDRELVAQSLEENYAGLDGIIGFTADDGTPFGIGGPVWLRPNVASLLFFATDDFRRHVVPMTRYVKGVMMPGIRAQGAHRIECFSLSTYTEMQQWVELFGLRPEATLRGYGRNGEDFISFAWVKGAE
jgi:hypothetical protein